VRANHKRPGRHRNPVRQQGKDVKESTLKMVRLALESDDTVSAALRGAILARCREPLQEPPSDPVAEPAEQWLSRRQAARMLSVSVRTVERLVKSEGLPSRRILGCRRIPASALSSPRRPLSPSPQSTDAADSEEKGAMEAAL
jgi:excisionase family DNA binding protein